MEFRILGPLYANAGTGQGPAVIPQPLLQSALAVLLLRANRPCPRNWLIEALWAGEPPAAPDAAMRVCISRLRHCLGDCAERLDSLGPPGGRAPGHRQQRGYTMTVRPGELDLDEFSDLVAQGHAELDMGNAAAAAATLAQAMTLWADPPLPDLPDSPVIATEVAALKNQRLAAADALIDARLAAGHYELVLGQLRAAVIADPGRERSCGQLMRAYHALGMSREALDVYQMARQATLEQQGTEPGPVLALLHRRILAEDLGMEGAATTLTRAPLATSKLPPAQVPAPPPDFSGRGLELTRIIGSLTGPGVPVTVVTGGPGSGKSAIAATAALKLRDRFPDGQLYAELGGVEQPRDPQDVLADMLQSLGIAARSVPAAGPPRVALYRSLLAGRHLLVVADDAAFAAQVRPLIPAGGGAAMLVTSRSRLSGLAGASVVELGGLPDDAALGLLSSAAGPGRTAAEPTAASAIVAACGGLPLALRLAGAALAGRPGLTVTGLARELSGGRALEVLAAEDTSVEAAIGSSYRAASPAARAALSLAALSMPAEIPAWALADLADGDSSIGSQLAAVGLLAPAQSEVAGPRFRMHLLTRAYAIEREPEHGPRGERALARMQAGWIDRADQAAAGLPALPFLAPPPPLHDDSSAVTGKEVGPEWLDIERASLLTLTARACSVGDHQAAAMLAERLTASLCFKGGYADGISTWRSIAAAAAQDGDAAPSARASYHLAVVLAESHDHGDEAARLLTGCLPVLEQSGELHSAAMAIGLLARLASGSGRHAAAIRAARHAIRVAATIPGGALADCAARTVIGLTLARIGSAGNAARYCRDALATARGLGESAYEAHAARVLAQVLILSGQHAAAASLCRQGISLARGYGSEITAARFMLLLGRARQRDGDPAAAADSLLEALEIFRMAGSVAEEVTASSLLAACSRAAGDRQQAAAHLDQLTEILVRRGMGSQTRDIAQTALELAAR